MFLPCWPTAWLVIVAFAVLHGAEADMGKRQSEGLARFAYVAWWVGAVWTALVPFCVLWWLFSGPRMGGGRQEGDLRGR